METKYNVGQIIFTIDSRRFMVTPYQITEHHVKTRIDGTENIYFAKSGRTQDEKDLSEVPGPVFKTAKLAGEYHTKIATDRIDNLVKEAQDISRDVFGSDTAEQIKAVEPEKKQTKAANRDEEIVVNLPDGRQAKLKKGVDYEDINS